MPDTSAADVQQPPALQEGRVALAKANIALLLGITLPMRFAYANDCASHSVAADHEASLHYKVPTQGLQAGVWKARVFARGFLGGLFTPTLPDHFVDGWFTDSGDEDDVQGPRP